MTWAAAVVTGVGVGLAFFGALWLSVQRLPRTGTAWPLALGALARLGLVGLVFCGLAREGPGVALAGLGGLWLARW